MPSYSSPRALISSSDIARLARINRATISNWRRRGVGFPDPIGGEQSRPLFDLDQVVTWLSNRGIVIYPDVLTPSETANDVRADEPKRRGRGKRGGRGRSDLLGQRLDQRREHRRGRRHEHHEAPEMDATFRAEAQLRGILSPYQARRLLIELLAYSAMERRGELAGTAAQTIRQRSSASSDEQASTNPALAMMFDDLVVALDKPGVAEVAEHIVSSHSNTENLGRVARKISRKMSHDRFGAPQFASNPEVARLLTGLVKGIGSNQPQAVLGCGTGSVLARLARSGAPVTGYEVAPEAAEIAAARLAISGASGKVALRDLLSQPPLDQKFNVVICDTPFGVRTPGSLSPALADSFETKMRTSEGYFLSLTQQLLTEDGHGVIVLPASYWYGAAENRELVKAGLVEAVIDLPAKIMPAHEGKSVVVVLRGSAAASPDSQTLYVQVPEPENVDNRDSGDQYDERDSYGPRGRRTGCDGPHRMSGLGRQSVGQIVQAIAEFRDGTQPRKRSKRSAQGFRFAAQPAQRGFVDPAKVFRNALHKHTARKAQEALSEVTSSLTGLAELDVNGLADRIEGLTQNLNSGETRSTSQKSETISERGIAVGKTSFEAPIEVGDLMLFGPRGPHRQPRFVLVTQKLKDRLETVFTREFSGVPHSDNPEAGQRAHRQGRDRSRSGHGPRDAQIVVRTGSLPPEQAQFIGHVLNSAQEMERIGSKLERFTPDGYGGRGKALADAIGETVIPQLPPSQLAEVSQTLNDLEGLRALGEKLSRFAAVASHEVTASLGKS